MLYVLSKIWSVLTDTCISWCCWSIEIISSARSACAVFDVDHWLLEYDRYPLPPADILPAVHSHTDNSLLVSKRHWITYLLYSVTVKLTKMPFCVIFVSFRSFYMLISWVGLIVELWKRSWTDVLSIATS